MKKRTLLLTLAATVLVWGFGTLEARAAQILLPAQLSDLLPVGNFAVVGPEPDTFSNFTYDPHGSPPTAAQVTVSEFHVGLSPPPRTEDGLTFSGAFTVGAGGIAAYTISYLVTAPKGFFFTDAYLTAVMGVAGGTGTVDITETLTPNIGPAVSLEVFRTATTQKLTDEVIDFGPGVSSILVTKGISLVGGSAGATASSISQGFSSLPEPASMSLLGIGMAGFFAFRRIFKKRTTVA